MTFSREKNRKFDYWILNIRLMTLLRILRSGRAARIGRITYVESTLAAAWFMKFLFKVRLMSGSQHKIQPRFGVAGPVFHFSEIRNEQGRLITLEAYASVLKARRLILDQILESFDAGIFFRRDWTEKMLQAWLGMKIADEINSSIYMAYFGRWKYYDPDLSKAHRNVLILSGPSRPDLLADHIRKENLMDEIHIEHNRTRNLKRLWHSAGYVLHSLLLQRPGRKQPEKRPRIEGKDSRARVMVNYSMGMKKGWRNDIPFLHAVDFDFSRLVIAIHDASNLPDEPEMEWIQRSGALCFLIPETSAKESNIPHWRPTFQNKIEMAEFSHNYLRFAISRIKGRGRHSVWLLYQLWKLGKISSFWKDFLIFNQVGITVNSIPTGRHFPISFAVSEAGGIAVDIERSILFDYCTYVHNFPCHVRMIAGPYSLNRIPEPPFCHHTIQTGAVGNYQETPDIQGLEEKKKAGHLILGLFDELPNDIFFGHSIAALYKAVISLIDSGTRYFLVTKTKKPHVLRRLPAVEHDLLRLQEEGKCAVQDWKMSVRAVASRSDVVVCVPSTAAFESVLAGTPTLVFNPMRTGMSLFYQNHGLNRRIFDNTEDLTGALLSFAERTDGSIGDCGDLAPMIDAYGDERGSERAGFFLMECLDEFDRGAGREEAADNAVKSFQMNYSRGIEPAEDRI